VAACFLGLYIRIVQGVWTSVCLERCVLSGRGLCDGPITHPEESYWLQCVIVWSRNLKNEAALAQVGLLQHREREKKQPSYMFAYPSSDTNINLLQTRPNNLCDFIQISYHLTVFCFLSSVILGWQSCKLMRCEQHYHHSFGVLKFCIRPMNWSNFLFRFLFLLLETEK
jgi:hypothetical protein